jgi:hypothetical protein
MSPWLLALAITANTAPVEPLSAPDLAAAPPSRAADWRVYGPLRVDWANWRLMDGSLVTRSRNEGGQSFYISVNCKAAQINVTGATLAWKGWEKPQAGFEHRLISEACAAAPGSRN